MLKRRGRKDNAAAYCVKIIDKPHRVIALKVWCTPRILLPIKYVAELVVKLG